MQSTEQYTEDSFKKLEKDLADLDKQTNVKKIVDKNKRIIEQIAILENQLISLKNKLEQSLEEVSVDEHNIEVYTERLKQLKDNYDDDDDDDDLGETINSCREATKIINGIKKYYSKLKMEVMQLK